MKLKLNLDNGTIEYLDKVAFIQGQSDTQNKIELYCPLNTVTNVKVAYTMADGKSTIALSNNASESNVSYNDVNYPVKYTFNIPNQVTANDGQLMMTFVVTQAIGVSKYNALNTIIKSSEFESLIEAASDNQLIAEVEAQSDAIGVLQSDVVSLDGRVDDLEDSIGYIELTETSGTLTEEQMLECGKPYCIINFNNLRLYKYNYSNGYYFFAFCSIDKNATPTIYRYEVSVSSSTHDYVFNLTARQIYTKSQIDSSLAEKQNTIDNNNKLDADLVDDTNSTHKFVSASEKTQITTNANAIAGIKDGTDIDSFSDVESGLALKFNAANIIAEAVDITTDTDKVLSSKAVNTIKTNLQEQIDGINAGQNLADIVADLTALNNLDTSKLKSGDKVQVLVDSNHDNASTVYNWGGSTWSYIGQYGQDSYLKSQTYNKTETDNLLNGKFDKSNIGYVELSGTSGTLTNDEFAEVQKPYCIIKRGNQLYYKFQETTTGLGFRQIPTVSYGGDNYKQITNYYINVVLSNQSWSYGYFDYNFYTTDDTNTLLSAKENLSNKVVSISSSSTDDEYPSAKCVYDIVGDIETLLASI